MKKYRHKQTQDIVVQSCESGYYKNVNIPGGALIPGKYIENVTDWEQITEKDYEILETRISNNLQHVIWKVKRLSDGEIFQVNDNIKGGKIKSINIENDKIYLEV